MHKFSPALNFSFMPAIPDSLWILWIFCFDCCFISTNSESSESLQFFKCHAPTTFFLIYYVAKIPVFTIYFSIPYSILNSFTFLVLISTLNSNNNIEITNSLRCSIHSIFISLNHTTNVFPGRGWCYSLRYISKLLAHTYFRYTRSIFHCPLIHSCHVCISNLIFTCHGLEYLSCTFLSSFD